MISNSLEWNTERTKLQEYISTLPYNRDLHKLLYNVDTMVDELSRMEVDARRTKQTGKVGEQLGKINSAIETVEQWIMMAQLLR